MNLQQLGSAGLETKTPNKDKVKERFESLLEEFGVETIRRYGVKIDLREEFDKEIMSKLTEEKAARALKIMEGR